VVVEFEQNARIGYCGIPQGFVLYSTDQLFLNDGVYCGVSGYTSTKCNVAAFGSTTLGVSASADDLHTPNVFFRNNATIREGLWTNNITSQTNPTYTQKGPFDLTLYSTTVNLNKIAWTTSTFIQSSTPTILAPGRYGDVTVQGNATLVLGPGRYRFDALYIESGTILQLNPGSGTIEIYTNDFSFRGTVTNPDPSRVLVGILGSGSYTIDTQFRGSIWAPNGSMSLGQSHTNDFVGSFWAKELTIHQRSNVLYVPFIHNQECSND
jgi:hypothetical protein